MKTDQLRKKYLDFFAGRGHTLFRSDTLVPDDGSLLFTSAGMNQFKPYFLGEKKDVKTATSCQKCLRTGDLDNVGKTAYHHTFFEMLGNFSFGDYFKEGAIELAWEFVTRILDLKEADLWVSVYKDDDQALEIWQNHIGVAKSKIIKLGEDSNFWPANAPSLGPNGPCGPCSEIFFDRGKNIGCKKSGCNPDCNCGRFIEIWNLVFTQFSRVGENRLEPLPQKNIDTGMGLERIAAVMQGVGSNFEIDILKPIVDFVSEKVVKNSRPESSIKECTHAIADHGRAATFAIADGVYPSNEERGYVVRKIIRRALLKARALGNNTPFIYTLVDFFAKYMGDTYPEVKEKKEAISKIILSEEEKYFSTIEEARVYADSLIKGKSEISSKDLFYLYDTYGLPLEEAKEFAKEHKVNIDEAGFYDLLKKQQAQSRKKSMFDTNIFKASDVKIKAKSEFIGYECLQAKADALYLLPISIGAIDQVGKEEISTGQEAVIVLDKTPFYPEGGGQLTDKGIISSGDGQFKVERAFRANDAILHQGRILKGKIKKGPVLASVDSKRRAALARAHTATHLLQAALRKVLGAHITQQGSLVDEDKFRFDFTHFKKLSEKELAEVEKQVKSFILGADKVRSQELLLAEAKKQGALAFFKDKYSEKVRVISVGDYSRELCGGTHLDNVSEVGSFVIASESSISSGIRRIEAFTFEKADQYLEKIKSKVTEQSKKSTKETKRKDKLKEKKNALDIVKEIKSTQKGSFVIGYFPDASSSSLLYTIDVLRAEGDRRFIFLVSSFEGKEIFVSSTVIGSQFTAKEFVLKFKEELSLRGGGKDHLVQGVVGKRDEGFLKRVIDCHRRF